MTRFPPRDRDPSSEFPKSMLELKTKGNEAGGGGGQGGASLVLTNLWFLYG